MYRVVAIFILILASFPHGTAAPASEIPNSTNSVQTAALALIHFPWQQLRYEIAFLPPQKGFRAMTIAGKRRIEVYIRPGDNARQVAFDIAHELGHAIDLTLNTNETRKQWMAFRGIDPATPWFGCNRCSDYNTPAGDFAETFALFLLGPAQFSGRIAPAPTKDQLRVLSSFFPGEDSSVAQANN